MSVLTVPSEVSSSQSISGISFSFPTQGMSIVTRQKSYRIVLEKDEDGRVVVRCPDLQGVVTDGADENEAIRNAIEAIIGILETKGVSEKPFNLIVIHKSRA